MRLIKQDAGFTILELMIATMVFSVILLMVTYGIIKIGNRYYKATLQSSTQTAVRNVVDEVTRNLQYSGPGQSLIPATPGGVGAYCSNGVQYAYVSNQIQDQSTFKHILVAQPDPGGCSLPNINDFKVSLQPPTWGTGARDLLANRMRIANFSINQLGAAPPYAFTVKLRVVTGEYELLCSPTIANDCYATTTPRLDPLLESDLTCRSGDGSQYCAVSELSTLVTQRISQ